MRGIGFSPDETALLGKLNQSSWTRSFSPEHDLQWATATTTLAEWRALYRTWSLLLGSRHDESATDAQRVDFARYQQMNLMQFTAIFERAGLVFIESLFRDDDALAYQEYLTHLVKEETYHTLLFLRAIGRIQHGMPDRPLRDLPRRHVEAFLAVIMWTLRVLPSWRLRHAVFFFLFRFVEEITLQANTAASRAVPRAVALVPRVWSLHARDEARHVAFDDLMLARARLPRPLRGTATLLATGLGAVSSLLLNLNEIWAARALGIRVSYFALPGLMHHTPAPFKRRVFLLLFKKRDTP